LAGGTGAGGAKKLPNHRRTFIYALAGVFLSCVFGYLVYDRASSAMHDRSLAELKRSADASGAEFTVRMSQMLYGMSQAAAEPYIKEAISHRRSEVLNELMRRWKKERPYIEIWAFTDSSGKVISALGQEESGFFVPARDVLQKAVQTGQPVMSVEKVPARDVAHFGGHLSNRISQSANGGEPGEGAGMLQVVAVPVSDDSGSVIGAIVTGILLNGDGELVKRIYETQEVSNAVFLGSQCIDFSFDGGFSSGKLNMSQEAQNSLYGLGQGYTGREFFNNTGYIAVYSPLRNLYGQVIGAQAVALREESYEALPGWIRNLSALMGVFMGAIFFVIANNMEKLNALIEREKEHSSLLSDLRSFASKMLNSLTEEEMCGIFLQHVGRRWDVSRVFIRLVNSEKGHVSVYRLSPRPDDDEDFVLEKCRAHITGKPLVFNSREEDIACHNGYVKEGVPSYLCLPLNVGGKTIGVVHLAARIPNYWTGENINLLQSYLDYLAPAVSSMQHLQALEEKAFEDQLTGLKNRRFLEEFLSQHIKIAGRQNQPLSVLMLDIDHFKKFNDQYGHDAGDLVLKVFSRSVRECLRDSDLAARYGGEEFTVVLVNTGGQEALEVAERIRDSVSRLELTRINMANPPRITVSIGTATFPEHGKDLRELIGAADRALYEAKGSGRNRVCGPTACSQPDGEVPEQVKGA
jgi:diguanylate cyclase (GGDEF)-like protein